MSTTYTAYAGLGVKIPKSKIISPSRNLSCDHEIGSHKFCPECGRKADWSEEVRKFDPDEDAPKGLTFVQDGYEDTEAVYVFGTCVESEDGGNMIQCDAITVGAAGDRVSRFLKPLGLWNAAQFGLWAVQDVS